MTNQAPSPTRAWQMALDTLRMEMPKASYDTWVRDAELIAFNDGTFTIGVTNAYAQEWLNSRLTSTINRILTGIMNQPVRVDFTVWLDELGPFEPERDTSDQVSETESVPGESPNVLNIQAAYQSLYEEIVQPDRVIVFRGYFLRYLPLLGPELAWMYIGFRQAAYEAGAADSPSKTFAAPARRIAQWAGMSLRTFRRRSANPETWQRLRWLVEPVHEKPRWRLGEDGQPHQSPKVYEVTLGLPLTPFDEKSLRSWLQEKLDQGNTAFQVIRIALETLVEELIPWSAEVPPLEEFESEPHSVQDVVFEVCQQIEQTNRTTLQALADELAQHLMPSKDLVFVTHYFARHWLPRLGPGPGWFITLLRDRGYINHRTGEIREEVRLENGYTDIAHWLGLRRVKTVWEWLRKEDVARFIQEIGNWPGKWETTSRHFKVCLGEPMTPEDQSLAEGRLHQRGVGAPDTHNGVPDALRIGADVTHNGASDTLRTEEDIHKAGALGTLSGAGDTHAPGADGISNGGNGTHILGAVDTPPGANGTPPWREWHRLSTLTLDQKHSSITPTTLTEVGRANGSAAFTANREELVVGFSWRLEDLPAFQHISSKSQETLLNLGACPVAFISWLIYAASPRGMGIRDPVGHAISRLVQGPKQGAGGAYDRLAELPPEELTELIQRELNLQRPGNQDWRNALDGTPRSKLSVLAEQLGIPTPDFEAW